MPGIAGIITRKPAFEESARAVKAMVAVMDSEPFYVSGTHFDSEMRCYVGWVAHENSFAAMQLFWNEQKDIALVFSGECFLDSQIEVELRRNDHNVGITQGSWLVRLYERDGEQFVRNLNGLFSGILIDKRKRKAFLFNDRFGMERIYWHETADTFYFASEAKALLSIHPELRRFDEQGVAQFLAYGCTLEERTLFKGISRVPAGSWWSFENGTCARHKYFSPESWESQTVLSAERFECEFQSVFRRVLPRYANSDKPLGISLTAGLDTRMIMACLPEAVSNAVCYTYSGQKTDTVDARLAARVAAACGSHHKILRLGADFFDSFSTWADKTVYATDGNFGIIGAHETFLSRQARALSPLRLTGVSGGEILRGISTFKPTGLSAGLLRHAVTDEQVHCKNEHPISFAAFKEIPWNLFGSITACRSQLCLRSPFLDNELVALAYRAPACLRKSPDFVSRFIRNNSKAMANIPTDMGYLGDASSLAAAFNKIAAKVSFKLDYYHTHGLPPKFLLLEPVFRAFSACTQRFGSHRYLHYRNWFREELAFYVKESLTDIETLQSPIWNSSFVKRMGEEHISGRENYAQEINAVLTLGAIDRLLFKNFSREKFGPTLSGDDSYEVLHSASARSN